MSNAQYVQSREESVTLLKLVISEMMQHDAPCNPATFAVCYEYLAGINPQLTNAVQQAKQAQPRLGAEIITQLYADYVAPVDEQGAETVRAEFQRVMREVARSAAATGASARAYGSQLADLSRALVVNGNPDAAALSPQLSQVADGTAHMQTMVAELDRTMAVREREIDALREALARTRVEAITDALSKLRNRKGFDDALREVLATQPPSGLAHCLVIIDVDHFKRVNDTHGHPVGDMVIETIGQLLTKVANGPDLFAARIGGEEFAVLLRAATTARATQLAEVVRTLMRGTKIRKRGTQEVIATVTVSAGVAAWKPGSDGQSLIAAADAALYRAKNTGRDRVAVA